MTLASHSNSVESIVSIRYVSLHYVTSMMALPWAWLCVPSGMAMYAIFGICFEVHYLALLLA